MNGVGKCSVLLSISGNLTHCRELKNHAYMKRFVTRQAGTRKSPEELVKKCDLALDDLVDDQGVLNEKANESISKRLGNMKNILYGEGGDKERAPNPEQAAEVSL
jgi:hypothetical protein